MTYIDLAAEAEGPPVQVVGEAPEVCEVARVLPARHAFVVPWSSKAQARQTLPRPTQLAQAAWLSRI